MMSTAPLSKNGLKSQRLNSRSPSAIGVETSAAICRQPFGVLRQQRLLDEQQAERLERLGQLLGQRAVDAAVEVEPDVHALAPARPRRA